MRLTHENLAADADTLREIHNRLLAKGYDSEYLKTRLAFQEVNHSLVQYIPHYAGCVKCHKYAEEHNSKTRHKYKQPERVYPNLLPTQASGRWSVTDPPKVTEPHPMQEDLILPDEGQAWICWDLDAIEAKIVAAYSDDEADLEAFENGYDIHTITSCRMVGDSLPHNLRNPHSSLEDAEWRAARNWQGKDDKRRGLAKVRYCVVYGKDHRASEDSAYAKEYVKQGGDRAELVEAARLFLRSKPNLVACKKKWWNICARACEARTFLGRRRRLFGDAWSRSKEGWNHMVQGAVTDMVNMSLIEILYGNPGYWLIYPSHDAAKISVPVRDISHKHREQTLSMFKRAVERDWTINNYTIRSTAGWYIRHANGMKEDIK